MMLTSLEKWSDFADNIVTRFESRLGRFADLDFPRRRQLGTKQLDQLLGSGIGAHCLVCYASTKKFNHSLLRSAGSIVYSDTSVDVGLMLMPLAFLVDLVYQDAAASGKVCQLTAHCSEELRPLLAALNVNAGLSLL